MLRVGDRMLKVGERARARSKTAVVKRLYGPKSGDSKLDHELLMGHCIS